MTRITLLDGSIGQELVKLSSSKPTPLWSTTVLMEQPQLVQTVHESYFKAGATICTTNTYTILPDRLKRAGIDKNELTTLTNAAVTLACQSRDARYEKGRVAGSIGPLEGSYRPDACPPPKVAAEQYKETVALLEARVDLFLIETMSSISQAEGALRACCGKSKPVWLAVTVMDDDGTRLRSGEPLVDLKEIVDTYQPEAVLINCSRPEAVSAGLDIIKTFHKPFGAYANGFTCISSDFLKEGATVDALQAREDLSPAAYAAYCLKWIEQGATIVGGCCEVGPAHIAEVAKQIRAAGHEIV